MTPRTRSNDWPKTRREALAHAEVLTRETNSGLPIDLFAIAKRRLVKRIEFRQLLMEGGLSVRPDGFNIYVNCDPGDGERLTEEFAANGTGVTLPNRIRARARFTIAHELAHTLLYDVRTMPPKPRIILKAAASLRSLERLCSIVAGALVLPEWIVRVEAEHEGLADSRKLRTLADNAIISSETLVRRLRRVAPDQHPVCVVAAAEKGSTGVVIRAISRHYRFTELFTSATAGAPLTTLLYHPDLVAFGGELTSVVVPVRYSTGKAIPYTIECESRAKRATTTFLMTARPAYD